MVTGSQKSLGSLNREQAHPPVPYLNILRTRMMIELKLSCHVMSKYTLHLCFSFTHITLSYYLVVLRTVDLINAIFVLLQIFVR